MAGELRPVNLGEEVILNGWIDSNRDLGGLLFFDVRDRAGKMQCVVEPSAENADLYESAKRLRSEFVVAVRGTVRRRERPNPKIPTGDVELLVAELEVLNVSAVPPFEILEDVTASEELRLRYRYLDLRRTTLQKNLILRHRITQAIRTFLDGRGYIEVETPILMKSTPEGARDFLVPSRLHPGEFYALPQSPQLYKQLLMVAGMDRYFQIAKCFRDENLRADRQPEFTQLDLEMSFPTEELVYEVMEGVLQEVWGAAGFHLPTPFPRLTYHDAMRWYGSDKPDLRYELRLVTLTNLLRDKTEFGPFQAATSATKGVIAAIRAEGCASWSRKQIDSITDVAKLYGASGLLWVKVSADGCDTSAKRYLSSELLSEIANVTEAEAGDLILIASGADGERCYTAMGAVRRELANRLGLVSEKAGVFAPVWITEFPMFERDSETGAITYKHHPFTYPNVVDWANRNSDLEGVRARAYDVVMNGYELGSGSIRIHERKLQEEVFALLGLSEQEQKEKFGFILDAFQYGAPPHGGMAIGIDRITMLCAGTENIRDVIAFPKTTSMQSLMDEAPSPVDPKLLNELRIEVKQVETRTQTNPASEA